MTTALQPRWFFPAALALSSVALSACEAAGDDTAGSAATSTEASSPDGTTTETGANPAPSSVPLPGPGSNGPEGTAPNSSGPQSPANTPNNGAAGTPGNAPSPLGPGSPNSPVEPSPVTPQGEGGAAPSSSESSAPNPASGGAGTSGAPASGGTPAAEGDTASGGATVVDPPNPDPSCGSHKWACWPMPNPAGSGLPNEASYTDNGDGTVTDNVTGLVWQVEAPEDDFEWQAGIDYCEALTLGGADDWRLPTRIEMTSVMDYSRNGAKFDPNAFPDAQGGFHKTASDWILTINQQGAGAGRDFAWAFNMSDGIVSNAYSKATAAGIRCVRGNGAGEAPSDPALAPPNQYTVVADGEVLDNYTGLIWQAGYSDARS